MDSEQTSHEGAGSFNGMNPLSLRICARIASFFLGGLVFFNATLAHAEPQGGWWWNPAESGRGYFLEVQGPRLFLAGYFYDGSGRATWLVSNDLMPNPDMYSGRLLDVRGGQTLVGDYRAPGSITDAGGITLVFSDSSHGVLTWPGGSVAIERYRFHSGEDKEDAPMTGWWWNPAESGRGFSVELQGDHMFIGAYMYDAAGNPVWYVADAMMQSPTVFRGPLLQFANGQTMGGSYRAPSSPVTAGSITVEFIDADRATVTLSDEPALGQARAKGPPKVITIRPQRADVRVRLPDFLDGSFEQTIKIFNTSGRHEITASNVTWVESDLSSLNGSRNYELMTGSVSLNFSGITLPDPPCAWRGSATHQLRPADGSLNIRRDGRFKGYIIFSMFISNLNCGSGSDVLRVPVFIWLEGTFNTAMNGEVTEDGFQTTYRFTGR